MNVGIIGLGLMGSSLALAINKYCKDSTIIYGYDKNNKNIDFALRNKIIDYRLKKEKLFTIDLLFLSIPVKSTIEVIKEIKSYLNTEKILLTDMGSTKSYICEQIKNKFPDLNFIGGHPMTGRELSGPGAAIADLFYNKSYILITESDEKIQDNILVELLKRIGARIICMDSETHDVLVSLTSHLPHIIAILIINEIIKYERDYPEIDKLMGQGFRDFTRIAASNPTVWRDIFFTNQEPILDKIDEIITALLLFKKTLLNLDEEELMSLLIPAQKKRSIMEEKLWKGESDGSKNIFC